MLPRVLYLVLGARARAHLRRLHAGRFGRWFRVMNAGLYSSKTPEWATPQDLFDRLAARWGPFDLDVCATSENAKVQVYYTEADDGLFKPWARRNWMNPPYGREIGLWVNKASNVAQRDGARTVALLPARTDTAWWQRNIQAEDEPPKPEVKHLSFLKGRVRFGGAGPAPFPSAVVVFDG